LNNKPMTEELYVIGIIVRARGLRGEVKIKPITDHPERFKSLKSVILEKTECGTEVFFIERVRIIKNQVIVQFKNVNTRNDAEDLVGYQLMVPEDELVELGENEFFWFDLIGMEVDTVSDTRVGKIVNIIEGPANDVYVIEGEHGEILLPAVKQIIKLVDTNNKKIIIDPIPGLLSSQP